MKSEYSHIAGLLLLLLVIDYGGAELETRLLRREVVVVATTPAIRERLARLGTRVEVPAG